MTNNPRHPSAAVGYTTPAEVERLRTGGTAVVQSEPSDFCTVAVRLGEDDAIGSGVKAGAWVQNAKALIELNEKGAVSHPVPGLAVDLLRSAIDLLSTHTAAGAGPVGEAVARDFVQLPDGWLAIEMKAAEEELAKWPAGLRASFESLFRAARPVEEPGEVAAEADAERLREAWSDFEDSHDLVREGHRHIRYRSCREAFEAAWPDAAKATAIAAAALAARPGEVERLTRERDEARAELTAYQHKHEHEAFEGLMTGPDPARIWKQQAVQFAHNLDTAEAALAETRERLEKLTQDRDSEIVTLLANLRHMEEIAGETLEDEDAQMVSDIEAGLSARRAALSTQESSEALAGDGKEAGRAALRGRTA